MAEAKHEVGDMSPVHWRSLVVADIETDCIGLPLRVFAF
jgi:hypothetical protein